VQILGLIEEAGLRAAQEAAEPRGLLRVTMPSILAIGLLDGIVIEFMQRHPHVQVEISVNERVVDLVEEGFDLGVRVASRVDGSMVARLLTRTPMVACASPAYLRKHGTPAAPQDLARHNCLLFTRSPLGPEWLFHRGDERHSVKVSGTLRADNGRALVNAAVAGIGIAYEPALIVQPYLRDKRLRQVLPKWDTVEIAVDAVWPTRKFLHPKVRAFVDFLVDRMGAMDFSGRSSRRA
jgi:DNA-binding transcriptional LysR family regulator